jgi:hypothetical protein
MILWVNSFTNSYSIMIMMWFAMAGRPGIRPGPGCATTGRGSLSLSGRPGRTPGGGTGKQLGLGLRLGSLPVWAASSSSASKARGFPRRRLRVRARRPRRRRRAGCAGHSYLHCKPLRTWIHSYNFAREIHSYIFAREFTVIFFYEPALLNLDGHLIWIIALHGLI